MKNLLLLSALLISLASCENKKEYTIHGTVKNAEDGKIFLVNLHTNTLDTLDIQAGKFTASGTADEPTPFLIFSGDILPEQTLFFVDQGSTHIEFTANDPSSIKIKSCKTHEKYEDFTAIIKPILEQSDSVQMLAMSEEIEQGEMQQAAMQIQQKFENANLNFIKDNPKSYVSALLGYEYLKLNAQLSTTKKTAILEQLDPSIQESYYGKQMLELIGTGAPAPAFSLPNEKGTAVSLSSLRGKYVLIDFWASWCAPCRNENPNVVAAYNKYKNKNFTVLGVSLDENKEQWLEAIKQDKLNWQHVSDLSGWSSSVVKLYEIKAIPSNVLIDPQGIIVAKDLRGVDLENQLSNLLK